jgi:hypothetical protein
MAGDGANAAAAFARAERYLGATPETRQGLAAAIALQTGRAQADLPWSRTAFFWHYAFLFRARQHRLSRVGPVLAGLFCQLLRRRGCGRAFLRSLAETCLLTGGLITVVFAASTLMTLAHERHDEATWGARVFAASASERRSRMKCKGGRRREREEEKPAGGRSASKKPFCKRVAAGTPALPTRRPPFIRDAESSAPQPPTARWRYKAGRWLCAAAAARAAGTGG